MRDHISVKRASELHPFIRNEVITLITEVEKYMPEDECIRIVQGVRTIQEQNELYAKGRTKPGKKVTNARGGSSYHNYCLAIDYCRMKAGKIIWEPYQPMIDAFKNAGYEWGDSWKKFKDYPHFHKAYGYTVKQLLQMTKEGKFIPGTNYLDIVK